MNTERPENDDAAREPGTTGSEGTTAGTDPDATDAAGAARAPGADGAGADETGAPGADETDAAESGETGAAAGADAARNDRAGEAAAEETAVELTKGAVPPAERDAPGADARPRPADEPPAAAPEAAAGSGSGPDSRSGASSDAHRSADGEASGGADGVPATASEAAPRSAGQAGENAGSADDGTADEPVVSRPVAAHAGEGEPSGGSRRRSPVLIASVAAAVLLVGGGGAYLTSDALGGSDAGSGAGAPSGDGKPVPLALDDYSRGTGTPGNGTGGTGPANGIAPGEPNPYGVTYKAAGPLPDGPGSAPVYWARGEVAAKDVAALAKALGVEGTPVADGAGWKVGAGNDGSGPVVRVNRQAPGMWTFTRYAPGSDNCVRGKVTCPPTPVAPGDTAPVSEAAAKKAAAPVLKAVGQDDAKVDASQVMGALRVVNAEPVIGGLSSYGWTTGVQVSAQGEIVAGNGQLKAPVKGAAYPLLSAREALDALNAAPGGGHRMGIGGCASPVPLKDRLESPCRTPKAPARQTATVEDAVLGLAPHTSGGRQVLVPSWLFEVKAAGTEAAYTVTQPAVEPAYLKPATTPPPAPTPSGSSGASGARTVRVTGYTVEGRELTVGFSGGVCADYKATAVESAGEVKVTVTQTPWPDKVCIMIAKEYHQVVQLDEAPGSRKVVDSDGRAIPLEKAGARLPQTR
ncbi:hypothetical protein OG802_09660 [Streptomyces sp. NBC_00704]|uniref:hypothetical protein n=1 Tax=Streptomyces sp. NBC_00704 TaxID=2975809 RepID=UPI002E33D6F1|nr:hypothetical protein [Streptomyces sp. NBC_00704]